MHRVHEGKKYEFKCEMCPKILATQVSLTGHILSVHEKKRPMQCDTCDKRFASKRALKLHIEIVHLGRALLKQGWSDKISNFRYYEYRQDTKYKQISS